MSAAHKAELHPEEKITMRKWGASLFKASAAIGVIFLIITAALGFRQDLQIPLVDPEGNTHTAYRFYYSFLVALLYFLSIALGALFFVVLQHLVKARWSVVVRRIPEIIASGTLPILAVLTLAGVVLPMLFGQGAFGLWLHQATPDIHHLMEHGKDGWLNVPFFAGRVVLYFAAWLFLSRYFFKKSVEQDESGDASITGRLRMASAPAIIAFALTTCFAAFDLVMSVNPAFFSTIFGVYYFAGCCIAIFAVMALVSMILQKKGKLTHSITVEHYHDIGKLLFAFVFFWSYIAFSQFMLIWYANIPEETFWYQPRMFTTWKYASIALLVAHCFIPFIFLLSRWTKRVLWRLAFFSVWMLVMHYVDMFWLIMPEFTQQRLTFDITDITALLGVGGLFVAAAAKAAAKVNLIPVKDPDLGDSLRFENF